MPRLRRTADDIIQGLGHDGVQIGPAMADETDRGCALTAGEFINDSLEAYIRKAMLEKQASENDVRDFLTGSLAILRDLSPRIKAAYWFGLIGKTTYKALDNLKNIRNACAHRAGPIDFKDSEIVTYVRGLEEYAEKRQIHHDLDGWLGMFLATPPEISLAPIHYSQERKIFTVAVLWLNLTIRIRVVNPVMPVGTEMSTFDLMW